MVRRMTLIKCHKCKKQIAQGSGVKKDDKYYHWHCARALR